MAAFDHPEVQMCRKLAEDAIAQPRAIWTSRSDADCRIYYAAGPWPNIMVAVVADVKIGVVKTAYLARKTSGAELEWSLQPQP